VVKYFGKMILKVVSKTTQQSNVAVLLKGRYADGRLVVRVEIYDSFNK
jgi:hypothetical protein